MIVWFYQEKYVILHADSAIVAMACKKNIQMKKELLISATLFSATLGLFSCTADDEQTSGKGAVRILVDHSAAFTRALDMSALTNTDNYTVDIFDAEGKCMLSKTLGEMEDNTIELEAGEYSLAAHYGESKAASQDNLYMKGTTTFNVEAGKDGEVSVMCTPASARVSVAFDDKMEEYFSDYYVTYTTKALTEEGTAAIWSKTNSDPWYLLVENNETVKAIIHVTRKSDGKSTTIEREHSLSAGKAWTLSIEAKEEEVPSGDAMITIVIDDSTNDKEETITVPNNWWM